MGFKTFDFFQKVKMDNVSQPTMIGSLLSLSAISIMIFLFFRQLIGFYSYHTTTDSVVYQPKNSDEKIPINMELIFNSVPCNILSLDIVDVMNHHKGDIQDTIYKTIYENNNLQGKYTDDRTLNGLVKAIESNKGCGFVGKIEVNQVPGEYHISFHNYRSLWHSINNQHKNLAQKIKLTHSIKKLSFGNTSEKKVKQFGLDTKLFFRSFDERNTFKDEGLNNYNYFVKIIPYMLVDENRNSIDYAYSFSLSSKTSQFDPRYDEMPQVSIRFEFSPILMKVTHEKRDYLHFLTHVSAIVGGVFVVFSIINRILTDMIFASDK